MIECYAPPSSINGPVDVTVTVGHQSVTYKYQFIVQNPAVTNVTPSTGTFDDQITIQGSNLILDGDIPEVYFGSYERAMYGPVVSATATSITATVPRYLDSIPGNIVLRYFNKQLFINTSAPFVLAPPVITSVSPSTLTPGQTITISGNNFNPAANRNQVFWGSIPFTVSSASKSEIIATVPDYLPRGSAPISIKVGGYTRAYPNLLNYNNSAWSIVPVPSSYEWTALPEIEANGISFATGGLGYIMDFAGKMTSFNPSSQTFTDVSLFPDFSGIYSLTKTSINDTILLFAGSSGFQRYDVSSSKWIVEGSLPTTIRPGAYEFYVNGKLFFGGNTESWTRYLWEYMPVNKIWMQKTVTTFQFNPYAVGSFVYNNKGYVLFLDNVLASYDAQTNSWTNMASCPGPANINGRITFMIDNMFYVGLGSGQSDLYRYDPSSDTWTQISTMPGLGRYNAVSFVLNGKAYVGFGFTTPGNNVTIKMNDFYEYDPNYPAK